MTNSSRTLVTVLAAAVCLGANLAAQSAMPESGLIGKRYLGVDFSYDHFSGSSLDQAMGTAAILNLPVSHKFDLTLGYSYLDTTGRNFGAIDKTLSASLLTHSSTEYGTAYFAAGLGHSWNNVSGAVDGSDNSALWNVRAGYEISVGWRSAVNLGVGYTEAFDRDNSRLRVLRCAAEANHWFSPDFAGVASIAYRQVRSSPDAMSYTIGLRWRF